ncbi:MAG: alpha/beta hydrolase [Burkholderiales bacterium]|nr:alpha/beta hydrolase [Anaerolineae bacterium]
MAVQTLDSATITAQERYTTSSVTSKDGTTIGYRQLGRGPGLILLHGSMESAQSHMQLAEALADSFTVYLPDRRGRGLSGPYSKDHSIRKDVEDMDALLTKTGAHTVFGVSSGALIWLQAALTLPAIHKAALFEPALVVNDSISTNFIMRLDRELGDGKIDAAMVTAMLGAQMGPPIFQRFPRWLLKKLTNMMMVSEDKNAKSGDITMRMLAPTVRYDFLIVDEMKAALESFESIRADVLLLGGSKSPAYLRTALGALEKILPHAKRVEFAGLDHSATGNRDQRGAPEQVAQVMCQFLSR